ncbi:MAG: hypothetical protein R3C44_20600 [Chloroflexota bacterium]
MDQAIPDEITPRSSDFDEDVSWLDITEPRELTANDLAFQPCWQRGLPGREDTPVVVINEPMFISDGVNSDLRYNAFSPLGLRPVPGTAGGNVGPTAGPTSTCGTPAPGALHRHPGASGCRGDAVVRGVAGGCGGSGRKEFGAVLPDCVSSETESRYL